MDKLLNDDQLIEKLAKAAHEIFCEHLVKEGYKYGSLTSESDKTHSSLLSFNNLPEDEKEQNRGAVRDIPDKLATVGYGLRPKSGKEVPVEFSKDEIENLAEKEHARWVKQKLESGWQFGRVTDKVKKIHTDMVSWDRLSDKDKEKDRLMVRAIPKIVAKAGYGIVKVD